MNKNDQQFMAQKIRTQYMEKQSTELDVLRELDAKVKRPANVFAYTLGIVSSLVAGLGMSLAMQVIGGTTLLTAIGIVIGVIGFTCMSINYPIYKKLLENGKKKYAYEIVELAREISEGR